MFCPPRHRRNQFICPVCAAADDPARESVLGTIRPYRGAGNYLRITRLDVTVRGAGAFGRWIVTCGCGHESIFTGSQVVWEIPALAA